MKRLIKAASKKGNGALSYALKGQMYTHTVNHGGNIKRKYGTGMSTGGRRGR